MDAKQLDLLEPRREAAPLEWDGGKDANDRLTPAQKQAAEQLWALFRNHYLDGKARSRYHTTRYGGDKPFSNVLPVIDDERRSQVVLIDGDRGAGKTALLVSLIDAWNRAVRREPTKSGYEQVVDEHGRVVPIGLLDLRSLPNDTSLLVHISGLLRGLVDDLGIGRRSAAPAISPLHTDNEAMQTWESFLTAAASTELRMRRRSAELDLQAFAAELHETEQDRQQVNERFARLIDHTLEAFERRIELERGKKLTPVFVIAIDDADMSPSRLAECFEVLHNFVHPRVVFLLTGESELFEATLRAQFLGELRRPLAGAKLDTSERKALGDRERAWRLANRYYAKLIPPQHRYTLEEVPHEERVERLRGPLEAIAVGDKNMWMFFDRMPGLASLLPGHLRELEDFKGELIRALEEKKKLDAVGFLVRLRDRLANALRAEGRDQTGLDDIIVMGDQLPFGQTARPHVLAFDTPPELRPVYLKYPYTTKDKPSREVVLYETVGLDLVANGTTLDGRIRDLTILTEYITAQLSGPLHHTPLTVQVDMPLSTIWRITTPPIPIRPDSPAAILDGWRSLEFYRIWRGFLEQQNWSTANILADPGLFALKLFEIAVHAHTTCLLDEDPNLSNVPLEARTEAWTHLLNKAGQDRPFGAYITDACLQLTWPESALPNEAVAQILAAFDNNDALLRSAELREQRLSKVASERRQPPAAFRDAIDDVSPDHPWLLKISRITPADRTRGVMAALAQIPTGFRLEPAPAWLPSNAAGYVFHRTRELLDNEQFPLLAIVETLLSEPQNINTNPLFTLFRAWQSTSSVSQHQGFGLTWNGFRAATHASQHAIEPLSPELSPTRRPTVASDVSFDEFLLKTGKIPEPTTDHAIHHALYRILYDIGADEPFIRVTSSASSAWTLFTVRDRDTGQTQHPWPAVSWLTFIDSDAILQRWHAIIENHDSNGSVGDVARRYVDAQLRTYANRNTTTICDDPAPNWFDLLDSARTICEQAPIHKHRRAAAFATWTSELIQFSLPSAALPELEAVALVASYCDVLSGLSIFAKQAEWVQSTLHQSLKLRNLFGQNWTFREVDLNHAARRRMSRLAHNYAHLAPDLFATPPARLEAIDGLILALANISLTREVHTPALANASGYLAPDLLEMLRHTYTASINCVAEALEGPGTTTERLHAAWDAAKPETPTAIRHDGQRWIIEGTHNITHEDTPSERYVVEYGVNYECHSGAMTSSVDEDIALIVHALIHDIVADLQVEADGLPPVHWPLARAVVSGQPYLPWPAVQWPTRHDLQLQLRCWQLDLEAAASLERNSLSARIRHFIAGTAHIYAQRTLYEAKPGSWHDVILAAHRAANFVNPHTQQTTRGRSYRAWVDQLPRFALPRVGLSHKHAADILVRYFDITKRNPAPELMGRCFGAFDGVPLKFEVDMADHPAVLACECETDQQMQECSNDLRKRYELG